jgi:hypothetical protein
MATEIQEVAGVRMPVTVDSSGRRTLDVGGVADTGSSADLAAHEAAADPHPGYVTTAEGAGLQADAEANAALYTDDAVAAHVALANPHTQYVLTTALSELVDDRVAALAVPGANISITYNDAAGTLTIAVNGHSAPFAGVLGSTPAAGAYVGLHAGNGAVRLVGSDGAIWTVSALGGGLVFEGDTATLELSATGGLQLSDFLGAPAVVGESYQFPGGTEWLNSTTKIIGGGATIPATSVTHPRSTKTGAYTLTDADEVVDADATSAAFQVTLPTAVGRNGRHFRVTRINSGANNVTIGTTSSQTINGASTKVLTAQWQSALLYSNGSNWIAV